VKWSDVGNGSAVWEPLMGPLDRGTLGDAELPLFVSPAGFVDGHEGRLTTLISDYAHRAPHAHPRCLVVKLLGLNLHRVPPTQGPFLVDGLLLGGSNPANPVGEDLVFENGDVVNLAHGTPLSGGW